MSNRFHNKFHRQNHHSDSTPGYPDSAMDPIASFEQPFKGEFYSQGDIITTENLSAKKYIYADDGVIHNNLTVKGNFTVLGTTSQLDTLVYTTSAVSITNTGTGPALMVTQTGSNPIAHFIDSNGDDIIFADNGYVGLGVTSPSEKLTIAGNLSSSGTATIGTITTGATNSVITQSAGILQKRDINPQVWDTTAKFVSASDGTLTVNRLTKAENNNGINESIVFDDGTNVGIGTDTPGAKLTVNGDISATGDVSTLGKFLSAGIDIATLLVGAGTDTEVRALTGNWESTYTTVQSNSSTWRLEDFIVACSDESTNLSVSTSAVTFRVPFAMVLNSVRASVNVAPVGSTIIADIKQTGTSIFSTKLSIDAGEETSTTAATPSVISNPNLTDDAKIIVSIDQVGSSTAGRGLKLTFKGYRV